jgi:ribonuclease P protein component
LYLDMNEVHDQRGRVEGRASFTRSHRLLKHADFDRVYRQGRRHFAPHMTFFSLARISGTGPRVGFTVSRALGGSVQRNRIRRRMREAVRLNLCTLRAAVDVVINPKKSALSAGFADIKNEVAEGFQKIETSIARSARTPVASQS